MQYCLDARVKLEHCMKLNVEIIVLGEGAS